MLETSVVFAVDRHYCEKELYSTSLFGNAQKCSGGQDDSGQYSCCEVSSNEFSSTDEERIQKAPCCSHERFISQDTDLKEAFSYPPSFIEAHNTTPTFSYQCLLLSENAEQKHYLRPPPDERSRHFSLYQVFII